MRLLSLIYVFSFYFMSNNLVMGATLKKQPVVVNSDLEKKEFATKIKGDVYREAVVTSLVKLSAEKNAYLKLEQKLIEENEERYNRASAKVEEILKQLDIKQKASLNNLKSSGDIQLENLEKQIKVEKAQEIEKINEEQKKNHDEQVANAHIRREEIKKEYEEELKMLDKANEEELNQMKDETQKILQELIDEHNDKIVNFINDSQSRLDNLSEVNNEVLENIVENFNLEEGIIDTVKREISEKLYPIPSPIKSNDVPSENANDLKTPEIDASTPSSVIPEQEPIEQNQVTEQMNNSIPVSESVQAQTTTEQPTAIPPTESIAASNETTSPPPQEIKEQDSQEVTTVPTEQPVQVADSTGFNAPQTENSESFSLVF